MAENCTKVEIGRWDPSRLALVHGSGFRRIMVVKHGAGVTANEVSEADPVQAREVPKTAFPIGLSTKEAYADEATSLYRAGRGSR